MRTPRLAVLAALALACSTSDDAAPRASLAGKVVLAGVTDASGVLVTLAGPEARAALTDASGAYAFAELPEGEYVVVASARSTLEGTLGHAVTVPVGGEVAAPDLAFTAVGSLAGRVTLGGATAGNAGILVALAGGSSTAVTDDAGDYRLERAPVGTHLVLASRSGYQTGSAAGQAVGWAGTTEVPPLALALGAAGEGTLAGVATLAGADLHGGTIVTLAGTARSATTAEDGSWSLEAVADGIYTLELVNGEHSERIPGVVSLPGGSGFVADGELHPLGEIELARARRLFSGELGGTTLLREKEKLPAGGGWAATPDGARIVALVAGALISAPIAGEGVARLARDVVSFRIAPDGAAVLYRTYAGTLEAVPPQGGAPVVLGAGVTGDPSFSPDGTRALFTTRAATGTLGHLADYEGGVASLGPVDSVTWAGGGAWCLAWDRDAETLVAASVESGAVATLATGVHAWTEAPADAAAILVMTGHDATTGTGTLSLVPLAGGGAVLATDAQWAWTWSDDAAKVAFARRDGGGASRVQVSAVADGATLFTAPGSAVGFSPGARYFLYRSGGTLHAVAAGGGEPVALAATPYSPVFSPGGEDVALVEWLSGAGGSYGRATVASLATGAVASSYEGPPGYFVNLAPQLSPDSARAYAWHASPGGDHTLVALPSAPGDATVLSTSASAYDLRFTPDGAYLVFPAREGAAALTLHSASVASDAVVDLAAPAGTYSFSPGSTRILFPSGGTLRSVPVAGGAAEVLANASWYDASPDGSTLALLSDASTTRTLVTAPAEGGAPTAIASDVAAYAFAGDRLVFTTRTGALGVSPSSGPAAEVVPLVRTYAVTPDAARLVYVDAAGDLGAVALGTGAVTPLAAAVDVLDYYAPFELSPSGARVAFARSGVVSTVPVAGGPVTPHVRSRPGTISWLDDGHLVVVRTNAVAPYGFQNGLYVSAVP